MSWHSFTHSITKGLKDTLNIATLGVFGAQLLEKDSADEIPAVEEVDVADTDVVTPSQTDTSTDGITGSNSDVGLGDVTSIFSDEDDPFKKYLS